MSRQFLCWVDDVDAPPSLRTEVEACSLGAAVEQYSYDLTHQDGADTDHEVYLQEVGSDVVYCAEVHIRWVPRITFELYKEPVE